MASEPVLRLIAAEQCKQAVLQFMAFFDMRDFAAMERCVTSAIEWQRPDQTVRGLAQLREVLARTPTDVRVRHVITNLLVNFDADDRARVESYFTVYRHVGPLDRAEEPAPLTGPVSVGRYRDELVLADGGWKIARKQAFQDFRRV